MNVEPVALPLCPADAALVVLTFNGAEDTIACLRAVAAMPDRPGRVIVVDNASQDDSVAAIRNCPAARTLNAEILPLPTNLGYASGNNAGLRLALQDFQCRAFWVLNNDTEPQPDSLAALCRTLNEKQNAAMAGSTLTFAHAPEVVQCAGGFFFNKFFGTTKPALGTKTLREVMLAAEAVKDNLDYLSGASFLIRREVLEAFGLMREEYFLYYEDAEFCLRVKKSGKTLAWAPESIVRHKEGGATGSATGVSGRTFFRPRYVDYLSLRNRIRLISTYFPFSLPISLLSCVGVAFNRIKRGQTHRVPLLAKAALHGLMGKMGPPPKEKSATVLFLTARADFGGGPEHLRQLLRHMPQEIRAAVACPKDVPYWDRFCTIVGRENMVELPHRKFSPSALLRLRLFCKTRGVTMLHSHGKGAGLYSRLLSMTSTIPCVHTFHGVHIDEYAHWKRSAYKFYERLMAVFTRAGIAVSKGEAGKIEKEGLMPAYKLHCIPNGVPVPKVDAGEPLTAPRRIASLSRFDYQKNSAFVVDVLLELKRRGWIELFQFTLIGDGPEKNAVMRLAEKSNVASSIQFVGATLEPHKYFYGALCYFSSSRWEGMPLGVLEAMAHGLPPVVSDVVGNRDAVTHNATGLLYPMGDAAAAAAAICNIVDDDTLRKTLGKNAKQFVLQHCDVRNMAAQTAVLLQHC